jgi:hypothetical protein
MTYPELSKVEDATYLGRLFNLSASSPLRDVHDLPAHPEALVTGRVLEDSVERDVWLTTLFLI